MAPELQDALQVLDRPRASCTCLAFISRRTSGREAAGKHLLQDKVILVGIDVFVNIDLEMNRRERSLSEPVASFCEVYVLLVRGRSQVDVIVITTKYLCNLRVIKKEIQNCLEVFPPDYLGFFGLSWF